MYARLDDELIDHAKIFRAGALIGKNGPAIALGFYALGLMWSNRHLTDGHLPLAVIKSFPHVKDPVSVADALVQAGLWEKNGTGGFVVHDFGERNPSAKYIKAKRKRDAVRKREERERERAS
jgi:hypothetical protein